MVFSLRVVISVMKLLHVAHWYRVRVASSDIRGSARSNHVSSKQVRRVQGDCESPVVRGRYGRRKRDTYCVVVVFVFVSIYEEAVRSYQHFVWHGTHTLVNGLRCRYCRPKVAPMLRHVA